jgi:hypothetical protein
LDASNSSDIRTTVPPATSNSKDDSIAHNSRNASNSRNEGDNRTANTVWMIAKAGMLLNQR